MKNAREEEYEYLRGRAKGLQQVLKYVVETFQSRSLIPEEKEEVEVGKVITKAAKFYAQEMNRCLDTNAFLAATVMGASVLESVLLLGCLRDKSKVLSTRKWESLRGHKTKPFKTVLMKAHLPDLLAIGEELKWFPAEGIPHELRKKLTELSNEAAVAKLCNAENSAVSLPQFVIAGSASLRNLLHPGRSSETSLELFEYVALYGCICVLMALGYLAEDTVIAK